MEYSLHEYDDIDTDLNNECSLTKFMRNGVKRLYAFAYIYIYTCD